MARPADEVVQKLLEKGIVSRAQLEICLDDCGRPNGPRSILEALTARGFLDTIELQGLVGPRPTQTVGAPTVVSPEVDPLTIGIPPAGESARSAEPPRRRLGPFEILGELGRGGMGVVYEARDTRLDRVVALKVIEGLRSCDDALVSRFHREAKTLARISHPGIVAIHETGEADREPFIAMELVRGSTLRARLTAPGPRDPREGARLLQEAAEALSAAHQAGIVHRDVKPENILLGAAGRPILTDFGLAFEGEERSRLTASGVLLGTPSYMAPEQASHARDGVGPPADVYALGAILYEWITGRPPHVGGTILELVQKTINEDVRTPRGLVASTPIDLEAICMKCLQKDPARRYPDAGSLSADLRRFLTGEAITARPPSRVGAVFRRARRHWKVLVPLLLALATAVGLVANHLRLGRQETASLEKSRSAAQVLLRWSRMRPTLEELEKVQWDSSLTFEQRVEACRPLWGHVEAFQRETPEDVASQATARALLGWVRWGCGCVNEGRDWMAEAARIEPDLPFGSLLQAMADYSSYLWIRPLPAGVMSPSGLRVLPPRAENEEEARLRERALRLLAETADARVWGEQEAADLRDAIAAILMLAANTPEETERRVTKLLGTGLVPFLETDLRYCRAQALYQRGRYEEALVEADCMLQARPRFAAAHYWKGRVCLATYLHPGNGEGTEERALEAAEQSFEEALRLAPISCAAADLATALYWRALRRFQRGEDTRPTVARALALIDQTTLVGLDAVHLAILRGSLWVVQGKIESAHGVDPRASCLEAFKQYDRAEQVPECRLSSRINRSQAHRCQAEWEAEHGVEPNEEFRRAIEDASVYLQAMPSDEWALFERALSSMQLGLWEGQHGRDPSTLLEAALRDYEAACGLDPENIDVWKGRAFTLQALGRSEEALAAVDSAIPLAGPRDRSRLRTTRVLALLGLEGESLARGDLASARSQLLTALAELTEDLLALREMSACARDAHYDLACLEALESVGQKTPDGPASPVSPSEAARYRDEAFRHLDRALEFAEVDPDLADSDPDLRYLHDDPRWKEWRARLKR